MDNEHNTHTYKIFDVNFEGNNFEILVTKENK
jgi:hypothetical protein